jgi:hypothetical protein
MARAHIEIDGIEWTLDEYEKFMYGTGEWDRPNEVGKEDDFFQHGSGCVIRKSVYETDFGEGARL